MWKANAKGKISLNPDIIAKSAQVIADGAGISIPAGTEILLVEGNEPVIFDKFHDEKISPVLTVYKAANFMDGYRILVELTNLIGRGKAGLIKVVQDAQSAHSTAQSLFDSTHNVRILLVEQAIDIDREIYLSITVDPVKSAVMLIGCAEGGMDIEVLAQTAPEKIITVHVDMCEGLGAYHINNLLYGMNLSGDVAKQVGGIVRNMYKTFCAYDAELVEINPLFVTKSGTVVAGDGKLNIDENSLSRQTAYTFTRDYFDSDVEFAAAQEGIPYLQFSGDIALMCAGAGLTTTVFDIIHDFNGTVATYLES